MNEARLRAIIEQADAVRVEVFGSPVPLADLIPNKDNPRRISPAGLAKLKKSLAEFEEMMAVERITVDENNLILGGNQRWAALTALGYETVPGEWVQRVRGFTEAQKREFVIKDNLHYGTWDYNVLANLWDGAPLEDWGVPIPEAVDEIPEMVEYDEEIANDVPLTTCPHCGARFVR